MIANLYLHSEAFRYNGSDSEETVVVKIKLLLNDIVDIVYKYRAENVFKTSNDLVYNCYIYKQIGLMEFIEKHLDMDESTLFYSMLTDISEKYDLSYDELNNLCLYRESETEVNSLLVINTPIDNGHITRKKIYLSFDEYKVVYSKDSWITLRRQILGNHPENAENYIEEAKKYFPRIYFHDNCVNSLKQDNYLEIIPRKITLYLACLNDKFYAIRKKYKPNSDRNNILKNFSGECGLDAVASLEGNIGKKKSMTFNFLMDNKNITVCCEPHLKISQEDDNYKGNVHYNTFHPRIYFAFDVNGYDNKIFVGSIGPHL